MARRHTHELTVNTRHQYSLSEIEGKRLPELNITLTHVGKNEDSREHDIEAKVKILYAGDMFLADVPEKLMKLKRETWVYSHANKREAAQAALLDAEEMVQKFLASGLFGLAVVDAVGIGKREYEYEPQLRVVGARVYTVSG